FYQELQMNAELFSGAFDLVVGGSYFWEDSLAPNFNITRRGTSVFPTGAQQAAIINNTLSINSPILAVGNADGGLFRTAESTIGQFSTSFGAFASSTFHIPDRLNLTAGVRRSWDEKEYTQRRFPGSDFVPLPGTTSTYVESSA